MIRSAVIGILLCCAGNSAVPAPTVEPATQPPKAVARPVVDDYFGTKVTDRYRYMESRDAETTAWMKAQGAWTRGVLDSIGPKKAYLETMSAFGSAFGLISATREAGGRLFYLERAPGADVFSLGVLEGGRKRMLIDTAALIAANGGTPYAIDWFQPSRDGSKVAVGISSGGSENSSMTVIDAATGGTIAGPVSRAQFGGVDWAQDGSGLYFIRLQDAGPNPKATDKYRNTSSNYWDLKGEPVALVGAAIPGGPISDPDEGATVTLVPHSDAALLIGFYGVRNEARAWWGKAGALQAGKPEWTPLFGYDDGITRMDVNRTTLFLMSHKDAPRFKVLAVPIGGTLAEAKTVIAPSDGQVIENIAAAADGLYVAARIGLYSRLLRVSNEGKVEEIKLPAHGSIETLSADVEKAGVTLGLDGWATPLAHYRYDPSARHFSSLALDVHPPFDAGRYAVTELQATAADGVKVPLTVIGPSGPVKPRPVLLDAYGAYGFSSFPYFGTRTLPYVDAGVTRAECAVRGGGEFGESWRLAGKGPTKPNSWRDFIACAEELIAKGYTTPAMLTITGTSAGGITVGRAATERPDLFAGAVARVGDVNALRMETMPAGPSNIPEFGTVKDPQGFKDLYQMDVYQHVKDDVRYPAFLITGGLNDPRVEPWEGAKLAARLQELPGHRPVLFRLEEQAGHGLGTSKSTRDAEEADITAFVLWRAGVPGWQPAP